jgi:hypothetical protein
MLRSTQGRRQHSSAATSLPMPPWRNPPFTTLTAAPVNYSKDMPLSQPLTCYRVTAGTQAAFIASDNRTVYMETPQLQDGTHTINGTVATVPEPQTLPYCVDYFEIVPNQGSSSSPGAAGPTSSSPQNVGTSSSPGASGPPTSPTPTRNVAIIAGGVGGGVGGIVILATLIITCCLLRKRRRDKQSKDDGQSTTGWCKLCLSTFSRETLSTYFSDSRHYPQKYPFVH